MSIVIAARKHLDVFATRCNVVAVPVLAKREVVAVLEFYMGQRCPDDEPQLESVSAVAAQLGTLVHCKRVEDERARLLRQAEAAEARFRGLLESAPDAVLIADSQGRIVLANREAEKIFDYERDTLVGQRIEVLVPARFRGTHERQRARYAAQPSRVASVILGPSLLPNFSSNFIELSVLLARVLLLLPATSIASDCARRRLHSYD